MTLHDPESAMPMSEDAMNPQLKLMPAMPTIEEVQQWHRDRARKASEADRLMRDIAELDRKLDAVAIILGQPVPPPSDLNLGGSEEEEPMIAAAVRLVRESPTKTLTIGQLRAELIKVERFRFSLEKSQNYFYTMIKRLVEKKKLTKTGKVLSLPP
jgi:hypothetical protein